MSQKNKSEGIFNVLLWALMALLPFVKVDAVIDGTLVPRQLFLGAFLAITSVLGYMRLKEKKAQPLGITPLALLAFFVFQCIAYGFATNTAEAAATLSRYAGYVAYFMLVFTLLRHGLLSVQSTVKAFVVLGAIAVLLTAMELMRALSSGKFWQDVYVIKATFGHKNILSGILMLSLPFYLMSIYARERIWSGLSLVLFFVALIEIFMLRTRGVWLATIVGSTGALIAYFVWLKNRPSAPKLPLKWAGLALVCSIGVGAVLLSNEQVGSQVLDSSNISRRAVFWNNSFQMLEANWLTGVGPGNWKIEFPKYGLEKLDLTVQDGVTNIQRPHNDYLWVWTEGGTFSFLAYLALFFGGLVLALRQLKHHPMEQAVTACLALGGILGYMVFSFGDFPLERCIPVLMLLTLLALLASKEEKGLLKVNGAFGFAVPLVLALVALIVGYYRLEGEKGAVKVLQANAQRNAAKLIDVSLNAVNPFFNMDNYANPIPYFTGTGYAAQQNFSLAIAELETALEMHPNHILSLNTLANTHRASGNPDLATPLYERSLRIAPLNARTRVAAADLYVQQGKYFDALGMLNLVQASHPDPRYKQLSAKVVQYFYENFEREQKYPRMMQFVRQRNPQSPEDFYRSYELYKQQGPK